MLDPRIYRAAFLPTIAAIVILMFSLEPAPEPLEGPISTPVFKGRETARLARSIATIAPNRTPGSQGDAAVAAQVRETFEGVTGGEVFQQKFEGKFNGETVELENVVLSLPGRRTETLLVVASRDSAVGQGAPTSAAATATLMQLANGLGNSRHERTIVLASLSGGSIGSKGVSELIDELPVSSSIEAAIVISQPGVEDREPPFVIPGRSGPDSVPPALLETATEIATVQFGEPARPTDAAQQFARLAYPVGIGDGAALAAKGVDTVIISGSGERPPPPDETNPENVSSETVFATGSTALDLLLTLDERQRSIPDDPDEYVQIGDSLLPGWPLKLLALTLLLPALLGAGDVWLRDRRRDARLAKRSIPWVLERSLLPLAALITAYLLGLVGLIPNPPFPYDPGRFPPGVEGPVALAVIALATVLTGLLIRPMRTPLHVEPQTLAAAAGILCSLAVLAIWLLNPFLALLLAPAAHVWLLPARAQGPPRAGTIAVACGIALVPAIAGFAAVAGTLDLGLFSAPWQVLLLLEAGQIGLLTALLGCVLTGGLLACVAASRAQVPIQATTDRTPVRGPGGYAGPGSLGGTPSEL